MSTKVYSQKIVDVFTRWRWHRGLERVKVTFVISHGNVILHQTSEFENGLGSQGLHLSRYQQQAQRSFWNPFFFFLVNPFIKDYFILESCLWNTWLSVWANTFLWNSCLQVFHNQDGEWGADVCVDVSLSQSVYLSDERRERMMTDVFMFVQLLHKRRSSWHTAIT